MPAPGVGDDGVKVGALRRPSQPRRVASNDLASSNASHRINYLTDRDAATGTEVDGDAVAVVEQILERQHMRAGEIGYMNVVSYGSAAIRSERT